MLIKYYHKTEKCQGTNDMFCEIQISSISFPFREVLFHYTKEKIKCADIVSTYMLLGHDRFRGAHLIKIAIVDDEKIVREEIESLIRAGKPDCVIDSYRTGREMILSGNPYDIVFLDICLENENGLAVAEKVREISENTVLIFVTGVKDYVFRAFDVAAFHYLLKPLDPEKFAEVFSRAMREAGKRKKEEAEFFLAKTRDRTCPIQKSSIYYVESRGKKAEIHTGKGTIELYASLNSLEAELGAGFYRSHRGYLVNMAHVSEYRHDSIRLENGETVYLAKEKYQEFVKAYMRYLKGGGISYG